MPSVVLFDLDGTLVDTMPALAALASEVLARHHRVAIAEAREMYLRTSGVPFAEQMVELFGDDRRNDGAVAEFEERKVAIARAARMDARSHRALRELRARGHRLVVSSNAAQCHVDRFAGAYSGLFARALGASPASGKGEAHAARICASLAVDRDALVFVGDSLRDGDLMAACGVAFVAHTGTFPRAAFADRFPEAPIVDHVDEIGGVLCAFQRLDRESA